MSEGRKNKKQFIDKDGIVRRYCTQCGLALPYNLFYDLIRKTKKGVTKRYKASKCKQCSTRNLMEKRKMKARESWLRKQARKD